MTTKTRIPSHRHTAIQRQLLMDGTASVESLAQKLGVSVATIRRDLTMLEKGGDVQRTHGGATIPQRRGADQAFALREQIDSNEKRFIARAAVDLIETDQTLFMNDGSGGFSFSSQLDLECTQTYAVVAADFDGDQDTDLAATCRGPENIVVFRNNGDGSFQDVTELAGVRDGGWGWGSSFGDLDNDGDLDIYHVTGWPATFRPIIQSKFNEKPARLFENLGDGTFVEVAAGTGADDTGQGRGTIMFDFDNDGDLDIFITNNQELIIDGETISHEPGAPVLLRNDTDNGNHWLKVTLDGEPPLHRNGIGSRVYVTVGDHVQMRELHASTNFVAQEPGRVAHFGVGDETIIDEIRVQWVNGETTTLTDVPVDQHISIASAVGDSPRQ